VADFVKGEDTSKLPRLECHNAYRLLEASCKSHSQIFQDNFCAHSCKVGWGQSVPSEEGGPSDMYVVWGKPFYLLVRLRKKLQVDGTCNLMFCVCYSISYGFESALLVGGWHL
jgi:hypothetical protein